MAVNIKSHKMHLFDGDLDGYFATVWQPSKCTCTDFNVIDINDQKAQTFTCVFNDTEQKFTCATVSTLRNKMPKYVADLRSQLTPPFLVAGVFKERAA